MNGKISLPLLEARMHNPAVFKQSLLEFLKKNNYTVNREKTIAGLTLYHQQPITAAGTYTFFQGVPAVTTTNMNNFIRPQDEHFVVTAFRIFCGNNATIAATDWVAGASLVFAKNAIFTVVTNGVKVVDAMPILEAVEDLTTSDAGYIYLAEPIVWAGQNPFSVAVTTFSAATASDNLRIEAQGVGLIS